MLRRPLVRQGRQPDGVELVLGGLERLRKHDGLLLVGDEASHGSGEFVEIAHGAPVSAEDQHDASHQVQRDADGQLEPLRNVVERQVALGDPFLRVHDLQRGAVRRRGDGDVAFYGHLLVAPEGEGGADSVALPHDDGGRRVGHAGDDAFGTLPDVHDEDPLDRRSNSVVDVFGNDAVGLVRQGVSLFVRLVQLRCKKACLLDSARDGNEFLPGDGKASLERVVVVAPRAPLRRLVCHHLGNLGNHRGVEQHGQDDERNRVDDPPQRERERQAPPQLLRLGRARLPNAAIVTHRGRRPCLRRCGIPRPRPSR